MIGLAWAGRADTVCPLVVVSTEGGPATKFSGVDGFCDCSCFLGIGNGFTPKEAM
jgi:hypothetical protein